MSLRRAPLQHAATHPPIKPSCWLLACEAVAHLLFQEEHSPSAILVPLAIQLPPSHADEAAGRQAGEAVQQRQCSSGRHQGVLCFQTSPRSALISASIVSCGCRR